MTQDLSYIFYWWLIVSLFGLIFYPTTRIFFSGFFDKGYILGKILGLLLVSYPVWLLASLKILPFTIQTIWIVLLFSLFINYLIAKKDHKVIKQEIGKKWKIYLAEEIIFFTALAFWSYVRGFQPDIQGLEKYMDYGFVNAILRSKYFPPADMWLSGKTINYYYFGHFIAALLTKISQIDSTITYNLMIGLLFAFTFAGGWAIGGNLISKISSNKKIIAVSSIFTAFILSLGGNLHLLYWWIKNHSFTNYWYPDATRFIVEKFGATDNTIHEFPIYSFIVADLHGHLINLPFALLFISLIISFITSKKNKVLFLICFGLLLGCFYMTNTWDFLIYSLLLGTNIFIKSLQEETGILRIAKRIIINGAVIFASFLATSAIYIVNFQNIVKGISIVDFHSPLWMLLVLWGFPLWITILFLISLNRNSHKKQSRNEAAIDYFVFSLLIVSWVLIVTPEVLYFKDIYIHSYQRANTMFKLTYQSFVMFSLASGYILFRTLKSLKSIFLKTAVLCVTLFFVFFIFSYHRFGVLSYYGLKNYRGLNGLSYLKNLYSDDYEAIVWLRENVEGLPVIVEAVGESYTDFARVSANTGLPTILGWRVHEWLWRGSFDEPGLRTTVVQNIYELNDPQETREILSKYKVKYVFVGALERKTYQKLQESKFAKLGEIVFSSKDTKVYEIK